MLSNRRFFQGQRHRAHRVTPRLRINVHHGYSLVTTEMQDLRERVLNLNSRLFSITFCQGTSFTGNHPNKWFELLHVNIIGFSTRSMLHSYRCRPIEIPVDMQINHFLNPCRPHVPFIVLYQSLHTRLRDSPISLTIRGELGNLKLFSALHCILERISIGHSMIINIVHRVYVECRGVKDLVDFAIVHELKFHREGTS